MGDSKRKNADSLESAFSWQGQKDSNPQQRFWRPTCYHYTMPLCISHATYKSITPLGAFVKGCGQIFFSVMRGGGVSRGGGLYEAGWLWYNHPDKVWRVRA